MNIYETLYNKKLQYPNIEKDLIERYYNITDFIDISEYGPCYCMFHDDRNKPSAKLFKDEDGIERMWCFVCRKQYTSWHYIKLILNENPIARFLKDYTENDFIEFLKDYEVGMVTQTRKSKLNDEEIKNLTEKQFIDLICLGTY